MSRRKGITIVTMTKDPADIVRRTEEQRQMLHLTKEEMARKLGIGSNTYYRLLREEVGPGTYARINTSLDEIHEEPETYPKSRQKPVVQARPIEIKMKTLVLKAFEQDNPAAIEELGKMRKIVADFVNMESRIVTQLENIAQQLKQEDEGYQ